MSEFEEWLNGAEPELDLFNYPDEALEAAWNAASTKLEVRLEKEEEYSANLESMVHQKDVDLWGENQRLRNAIDHFVKARKHGSMDEYAGACDKLEAALQDKGDG